MAFMKEVLETRSFYFSFYKGEDDILVSTHHEAKWFDCWTLEL